MHLHQFIQLKNLAFVICLCGACILGDFLVEINKDEHIILALIDNGTHGVIGGIATFCIVSEFGDKLALSEQQLLIAMGFVWSSIIDVDHFIEARSFKLKVF